MSLGSRQRQLLDAGDDVVAGSSRNFIDSSGERRGSSTSFLHVPSVQAHVRKSYESATSELSFLAHDLHDNAFMGRSSDAGSFVSSSDLPARQPWREKIRNIYEQNYGALLVVISQAFGAAMNVATTILEHPGAHGEAMHPFQILFVRQGLTVLFCTLYALTTKSIPHFPLGPPVRKIRFLLVCRGFFGFFGVAGMYFSLLYLPLSEATVLTFLAPIFSCYACSLLLQGETFSRQQQIAGYVSLLGVIFIAQPASLFTSSEKVAGSTAATTSQADTAGRTSALMLHARDSHEITPAQHILAVGIAMIGVVGATGAYTSIRAIGTQAHAFVSVNYFSTFATIICFVALLVVPDVTFRFPGNFTEWALLLSLGTCGFIMQGLLTVGLAYKPSATQGEPADDHSTDIEMHQRTAPQPVSSGTRHGPGTAPSKRTSSGTRATSMIYTQMLFASAADKFVFGTTIGLWSWIGSGLILGGAIWTAAARESAPKSTGQQKNAQHLVPQLDQYEQPAGSLHAMASAAKDFDGPAKAEEDVGLMADPEHIDHSTDPSGSSSAR